MNNAQSQLMLLGRILLGLVFLVAGVRKLMAVAGSTGYLAKLGFPAPEVLIWVAILIEVGGAALLILGWQARKVSWLLIVFVAVATFMAHRFWQVDPGQYANQMNHFLKNLAIIGGLLYVVAFGAGALSLDNRQGAGRLATT